MNTTAFVLIVSALALLFFWLRDRKPNEEPQVVEEKTSAEEWGALFDQPYVAPTITSEYGWGCDYYKIMGKYSQKVPIGTEFDEVEVLVQHWQDGQSIPSRARFVGREGWIDIDGKFNE